MKSINVVVPELSDAELIFDDGETRQILKFFWPEKADDIDKAPMSNDLRRLAQTMLIAAVDASYAMGWVDATFRSLTRPGAGIKSLCQKLARRCAKHWFKHATQRDLMEAKIYLIVRRQLANSLKARLDSILYGFETSQRSRVPTQAMLGRTNIVVRV